VSTPDFVHAEDKIAANMVGMSLSQYYKAAPSGGAASALNAATTPHTTKMALVRLETIANTAE